MSGLRVGLAQRVLVLAGAITLIAGFLAVLVLLGSAHQNWTFVVLAACVIAVGGFYATLVHALQSLDGVGRALEVFSKGAGGLQAPEAAIDHPGRMRANIDAIALRFEKSEHTQRRHPLTGLPLQDEFLAIAASDIENAPQSVLMGLVRIANYDAMAAYDPQGAERVLGLFARRLREALDPSRVVAHIDRDCFAIWFRGIAPSQACAAEFQALNYALSHEIDTPNFTVTPDVQMGSARYPVDSTDAENLLSRAFVSLARPQRTSDGGLAFFARSTLAQMRRRFSLEQELRQAIEHQQLEIHYQPIINTADGKVESAEALLRWRHPSLGAVSPGEFVPILEETGLIEEIGLWTLNATCRQLRLWRDAGLDLKIALNVSPRQLVNPALAQMITRTLSGHGLTPDDIELELTETAAMEDIGRTHDLFQHLRDLGFGLSIDDFGSGYSSLGYLKNLPFTKLKIDREFVTHIDASAGGRAICKALIELANGLGIAVMAEGVERVEEVDCLRALGCTTFQGFYFARPMPAELFHGAVSERDWSMAGQLAVHRQQALLRRRFND